MRSLEELNHRTAKLTSGGKVVVLDPGAILNAEATAMLQALHSRSIEGIDGHLAVLAERGPEGFMSRYYVEYGHKSIGDCGSGIVFVEGISMLAAKALQDSKLYNGQESSTRYINFEKQPFLNPLDSKTGNAILERWRAFYLKSVGEMVEALKERFPMQDDEKETSWEKAIQARAFDTTRGFLPAGATTNVAWSTTLRQFGDRILQLHHHPLAEVREIAAALEDALIDAYPNSFSKKRYEKTDAYLDSLAEHYYYHDPVGPELAMVRNGVDTDALEAYRTVLENRPPKTELPKWLGVYGEAAFAFTLDFGSFRDIQRHRAVTQRMPLLTADIGFHPWYLNELTDGLREEAATLIEEQRQAIESLADDVHLRQYYHAMGNQISNYLSGDLPSLVYLVELRASSLVHPTLSERASQMAQQLQDSFGPSGLVLHLDAEPGRFNVKRGEQDIVERT